MPANLDRKFEKFLGGPVQPPDQRLHVSMDKDGKINFNARVYRELGKPTAVYLHFSRIDDTIAIEPVYSTHMPAAFPLRPNGSGWVLCAASFRRHYGISLDGTHRFTSPEFRDGALQVKLSETVLVTRKRRWQKKSGERNLAADQRR